MKRAFATVLFIVALVACSAPEQQLVGRWQSEESGYVNQLELHTDGTYSGTLERRIAAGVLESVGHYAGRWEFHGGKFEGQVMESDTPMLSAGYHWADDLIEFNKDAMVLRSASAHEATWQRVQ